MISQNVQQTNLDTYCNPSKHHNHNGDTRPNEKKKQNKKHQFESFHVTTLNFYVDDPC